MRWLKRDIWKAGIALAGMLLILMLWMWLMVLVVWVPVSAAGTSEGTPGLATLGTGAVQATPTEDATVTALNKEKLLHDVDQQQHTPGNWFWNNGAALVSSLVLVIAGAFTLFRYLRDQRNEREKQRKDRQTELEKRAEERFQAVVEGLGSERNEAKIGAAITLRTFLRPGYEEFYTQTFDLAVAYLRLPGTPPPSEDPDGIPQSPVGPNTPFPLTTLRQALIVVFKEAFPLARDRLKEQDPKTMFHPQSLDASRVQLDYAYLVEADLEQVWMQEASLRKTALIEAKLNEAKLSFAKLNEADLSRAKLSFAKLNEADLRAVTLHDADLSWADLSEADLSGANLSFANFSLATLSRAKLSEANLSFAKLSKAYFTMADLSGAYLSPADLSEAYLVEAKLSEAYLSKATLSKADLSGATLSKAKLSEANLSKALLTGANLSEADLCDANLSEAHLRNANLRGADLRGADLRGADLCGAKMSNETDLGGTELQEAKYNTKVIQMKDEKGQPVINQQGKPVMIGPTQWPQGFDPDGAVDVAYSPSQSSVSPPAPSQHNEAQAPSAPPVQESTQTPDTDGSSAPSSQQGPAS